MAFKIEWFLLFAANLRYFTQDDFKMHSKLSLKQKCNQVKTAINLPS